MCALLEDFWSCTSTENDENGKRRLENVKGASQQVDAAEFEEERLWEHLTMTRSRLLRAVKRQQEASQDMEQSAGRLGWICVEKGLYSFDVNIRLPS